MLSKTPGTILERYIHDYTLFDLETTGLNLICDEVVEISAVKVRNGKIVDEFSTLVKPSIPISAASSEINHITNEMVANSPTFDNALYDFIQFAGNDILVGHNIQIFDLKIVQRDAKKYFGAVLNNDYVDTLRLARIYLPDQKHNLSSLAEYYHISSEGAHRALTDCRMNQQIFECMKDAIEHPSEAAQKVKRCPKCSNVLRLLRTEQGDYLRCASYPDCDYRE